MLKAQAFLWGKVKEDLIWEETIMDLGLQQVNRVHKMRKCAQKDSFLQLILPGDQIKEMV